MTRTLVVATAVLVLGADMVALGNSAAKGRPPDFAVRYSSQTGTVAPQYWSSTRIDIAPGGTTSISVRRGYSRNEKRATIHLSARDLDRLYQTLALRGAFTRPGDEPKLPGVGGGWSGVTITARGKSATFTDLKFTEPVYESVPPEIWKKLK